jgi:pimeloyl-ACP methyl ester carboxylesterase
MVARRTDGVTLPSTTDGKDMYFTGGYRRHVLDGIGHFPTREAPDAVSRLVIDFLSER